MSYQDDMSSQYTGQYYEYWSICAKNDDLPFTIPSQKKDKSVDIYLPYQGINRNSGW